MKYIATFKRFHLTYTHEIEADHLHDAQLLAELDRDEQRRKNHPTIELVEVRLCE